MDNKHEEKIIRSFMVRRLQDRVLFERTKEKLRYKLYGRLVNQFETTVYTRYIYKINHMRVQDIVQLLKREGAPNECYVMSDDEEYDGKYYQLEEALEKLIFNGMPYIISCIPGKLAFYQGEQEQGEPVRYLFKR